MTWQGKRRAQLPSDWAQRRQARLERDGFRCTAMLPIPDRATVAEVRRLQAEGDDLGWQRRMLAAVEWTFLTLGDALPAGSFARCPTRATDVDHHRRPDDHREESLRSLCDYHHKRKTQREAQQAQGRGVSRLRPKRLHPGLRQGAPGGG